MKLDMNPFQYEAANNLPHDSIVEYYIDDFNYSRFIRSTRNVFLVGERGSGKTMTLLYNSWDLQYLQGRREGKSADMSVIGIYVPCNRPLTYKPEYQLLPEFLGSVLAEHLLVLAIAYSFSDTLANVTAVLDNIDESVLFDETDYLFGSQLSRDVPFFQAVRRFVQREIRNTQLETNKPSKEAFYENTFSFVSMLAPMCDLCARYIPGLAQSHFSIMVDDAHSLSGHQLRALNSWISYRDHSRFSFKVAAAKSGAMPKATASGGEILEGHDYVTVDLEAPLHNKHTRYYELAKRVVERRLRKVDIDVSPADFFPLNPMMARQLEESRLKVRKEAVKRFGADSSKAINDYVYKQARAHYFRNRSPKANRPPYSGFETLVFLSTGVIRNLLEPCFWMFDRVVSGMEDEPIEGISCIPPRVQSDVIQERSERWWTWLREDIARDIEGCSTEDGRRAFGMLEALAALFRERLQRGGAEPTATSFTMSGRHSKALDRLEHLVDILRRAQLIYIRNGPAKDRGRMEPYYVLNRMLWPVRGLDPHGQHARISIRVDELWEAAETGRTPKAEGTDGGDDEGRQGGLFR